MLRLLFTLTLVCVCTLSPAQTGQQAYWDYIHKYSDMAVDQMRRYRIPASITLAQGILESGAGRGTLAREANNHFGVKCHTSWTGPYVVRDDDARGEHFRKYRSVAESYEDHSKFLLQRRYASLFTLSPTDYRGWARGLKSCGYATNPAYAESLITIIENYRLYAYDTSARRAAPSRRTLSGPFFATHPVRRMNGLYYIVCQKGDRLETIARESGVKRKKLLKYNELPKGYEVGEGDIIYFDKKKSKADKQYKRRPHVVRSGESLYDISQRYGIRLRSLVKRNDIDLASARRLQVGTRLRLR